MSKFKRKLIKLTKISDDHFEGNHPNHINAGFEKSGYVVIPPKIGERFHVGLDFSTSVVTEELSENNVFKTLYSTYQIEYLNNLD